MKRSMRLLLGAGSGIAILLAVAGVTLGAAGDGIKGSVHDLSTSTSRFNPTGEICIVCHTPHGSNMDPRAQGAAPLWNRTITSATFSPYSSPWFNSRGGLNNYTGQPDGVSLLCLSCHDGTISYDQFKVLGSSSQILDDWNTMAFAGNANAFMRSDRYIGTDLRNDHPISFTYDANLAALDGQLQSPISDSFVDPGFKLPLYNGKLQCATCHEVHNKGDPNGAYLLRVANSNLSGGAPSGLCLACHLK